VEERPEVSICIRATRAKHLPGAIESVLAQSFDDLEVVVSDDTATLRPLVEAVGDPRVRYHANERPLGPTGNLRAALNRARGRFVGALDDDDRLLDGYLDAVTHVLRTDPSIGVVFTSQCFERGSRRWPRPCALPGGRHDDFLLPLLRLSPVPLSAALLRREVWEVGQRDRPLVDHAPGDAVIWITAAQQGWPFFYVDRPLVLYRLHSAQFTSNEPAMRSRTVELWRLFRFDDAECETLRRRHLAEALAARGMSRLKANDVAAARRDVQEAESLVPRSLGIRKYALPLLGPRPYLVRPALLAYRTLRSLQRLGASKAL
jgi:glycosyltransferase involved in cell wall biosynthesis